MIAAKPTKQDLQDAWDQEPLAFHTSPMTGFEEQGLSAAQWALLTETNNAFWENKSHPNDPDLWAWAIDNTKDNARTLDWMGRLAIPVAPDTLVRLLLRSAASEHRIAVDTVAWAATHPLAWQVEKDKTCAAELLVSPKNIDYLPLLDGNTSLLEWRKASTGNGLMHTAVLYKSKKSVAALIERGASQEPNNEGVTPMQLAKDESFAWPSTFGSPKAASSVSPSTSSSPAATPRSRVSRHPDANTKGPDQLNLF